MKEKRFVVNWHSDVILSGRYNMRHMAVFWPRDITLTSNYSYVLICDSAGGGVGVDVGRCTGGSISMIKYQAGAPDSVI